MINEQVQSAYHAGLGKYLKHNTTGIWSPRDTCSKSPKRDNLQFTYIYQPCHGAGIIWSLLADFTTDLLTINRGKLIGTRQQSDESVIFRRDHSNPSDFFRSLWGVIYKRTFTCCATKNGINIINCLLSSMKLPRTDSVILAFWLSAGLDKGYQWWNWSRHRCTSTKLYSLGCHELILAASKNHVSNWEKKESHQTRHVMIAEGTNMWQYVVLISNIGMQRVWTQGSVTLAHNSWSK